MAVRRDYQCMTESCQTIFEQQANIDDVVCCPKCGERARRLPVGTKSYAIKGDNSSSITPKRHRT